MVCQRYDDKESKIREEKSQYEEMLERINLQSIGYFVKEGSEALKIKRTDFQKREVSADTELRRKLDLMFDEEMVERLLEIIADFTAVKEEIQFSLGMKVGAKLVLVLTGDLKTDF